ncbi:GspH/FimT family pseudopilin [Kaarinaea lacus]
MRCYFYKNPSQGFTLIELLVIVSLGTIILSFGVPSFSSFIKNNRVTTQTNHLVTDINYARSEAVTRGETVILCRSDNPSASNPSCGGTANTWTSGWLIFVSGDANSTYDSADDTLLRATSKPLGTVSIKSNNTSNENLIYRADGAIDMGGNTAVFAVCDERGAGHGNQLQISPTGRPRLITPVPGTCDSPSA